MLRLWTDYCLWRDRVSFSILALMIGKELRRARLAAGLTQERLAEKAKLHSTYIGLLERNKRSPSLDVFLRLCKAMSVSPVKLLGQIVREGEKKTR